MTAEREISAHYAIEDLDRLILDALIGGGSDVDALTADDLAPLDAFHTRGRAATDELIILSGVRPGHRVLDVGCGIGGSTRRLANAVGCSVVGIDLLESYCRVAEMLSARVGLSALTNFRRGSALEIPFPRESFDVVWTEHVQMNVTDKHGFCTEAHRVLKPGGLLAFHEIFAGPVGSDLRFPLPWASGPAGNHLMSVSDFQALLARVGFEERHLEDKTQASTDFFRRIVTHVSHQGFNPIGVHVLMGDHAREKLENVLDGLENQRLRIFQGVAVRNIGS